MKAARFQVQLAKESNHMRGFRASRAAQNFKSAHFGKQTQQNQINAGHNGPHSQLQQQEKRQLPDWLKIHETPPQAAQRPVAAKTASRKTHLSVVRSGGKEVSAKTTAGTKAVAHTRTKAKVTATPTRKRKAA